MWNSYQISLNTKIHAPISMWRLSRTGLPKCYTVQSFIHTPWHNFGHHKSLAGNFIKQVQDTLKKTKDASGVIFWTKATRGKSRMLYESVYSKPVIEYTPLAQSFLSKSQLHIIEQWLCPESIQSMGTINSQPSWVFKDQGRWEILGTYPSK